jgi:hypothetical protein
MGPLEFTFHCQGSRLIGHPTARGAKQCNRWMAASAIVMRLFVPARLLRRVVSLTLDTTKDPLKAAPGLKYDRHTTTWPRHEVIIGQHLQMEAPKGAPIHASRGNAPRVQSIGVGTDERAHPMSIGAILLIILFIALLGGFAAAHNRHRVLWRRPRIAARDWLLLGGTGRISSLSRSTKAMKCCGTRPRAVTAFSETWRDARPAADDRGIVLPTAMIKTDYSGNALIRSRVPFPTRASAKWFCPPRFAKWNRVFLGWFEQHPP